MITVDRLKGLGDIGTDWNSYIGADPMGTEIGYGTPPVSDVTQNSNIWAGALNTVGQLGVAFAPAVRNITTPYATSSTVGPYGTTTTSIPMSPGATMGNTLSSLGTGVPSLGGISPIMLLVGAALVMMMMGRGH